MMREEILKKFESEEFAKKIMRMKTKEEVVKALSDKGLTPTDEEINELGSFIKEIISKLETLPESELELIAGGVKEGKKTDAAVSGSWTWGGFATGLKDVLGMGKDALVSQNQLKLKQVEANATVGVAQAQAVMAQSASVAAIVVAAAVGVYAFREEIKNLWYSK